MSLKDKLVQSIQRNSEIFSRQAEAARVARASVDAVYRPLTELMAGLLLDGAGCS